MQQNPNAAIANPRPASPIPALYQDGLSSAFASAVQRLEDLIDLETSVLQERKVANLQDFNHRKRHGLLELTRMLKPLEGIVPGDDLRLRLGSLRAKLEKNRSVLQLHLKAVQEISAIIARAIQEAESDGTYSIATILADRRR